MSAHPLFGEVVRAFGQPLAAPSANRFGRISPTAAAHVMEELSGRIPLIVDGGATEHGIESTVVAVRLGGIEILRAGPITREELAKFAEIRVRDAVRDGIAGAVAVALSTTNAAHDRGGNFPGGGAERETLRRAALERHAVLGNVCRIAPAQHDRKFARSRDESFPPLARTRPRAAWIASWPRPCPKKGWGSRSWTGCVARARTLRSEAREEASVPGRACPRLPEGVRPTTLVR